MAPNTRGIDSLATFSSPTAIAPAASKDGKLSQALTRGTSALGSAVIVERGFTFLSNLLAARIAGAHTYGAYSLAMTTANNIANYAGAGIGSAANRFSGEYPVGSSGYSGLLRSVTAVSICSAVLAVTVLWFGSDPLARLLLRNPGLQPMLRVAAFSAGAIILLECMKGLLIGQRRFAALVVLATLTGGSLLILMPLAARVGAERMVASQSVALMAAVLLCAGCARWLGFAPTARPATPSAGPSILTVARFNVVQFAGVIGLNAAGWLVASMVSRADPTLAQMGYYAVANQLRNIVAMAPGLIPQSSFGLLTDRGSGEYGGPGRVLALTTWTACALALGIGGAAITLMPYLLRLLYGTTFAKAEHAGALAIATAVLHMTTAPAAARLTIVSLRATTIINAAWAAIVIGFGLAMAAELDASRAAALFLAAHLFSAVAVFFCLRKAGAMPPGVQACTAIGIAASMAFAALALTGNHGWAVVVTVALGVLLLHEARRHEMDDFIRHVARIGR